MVTRAQKLEAITRFGLMVGQNPWFAFLIGYLVGQVERVSFVSDLKDAEIAIRLSTRQSAVWPHEPFKAIVRGIAMPNTFTLVRSINGEDTPICVSLDFHHAEDAEWYQAVLVPSVSYMKDAAGAAQAESEVLWKEMDRTLDIYREAKAMLKDGDPERRKELEYYMGVAEEQMKKLSQQMEELNKQMKRITEREEQDR
jgi:uncharacterized protein YpiB (UPF0302 family)